MINRTTMLTVLAASSTFAAADIVASYSFTDLNGSYDSQSQLFSANAFNDVDFSSGGDVSLLTGTKGTAQYDTGFFGFGDADVSVQLEVFNITSTSADSGGIVTVTDADGDTLTASIFGSWNIINPFGFMFFNGTTTDFSFSDNGDQDGTFNGIAGSFDLAGLTDRLFDGAVSIILQNPGGFLGGDFDGVSTQTDGILIPAPGVLALAGVGVLGMATRRRTK